MTRRAGDSAGAGLDSRQQPLLSCTATASAMGGSTPSARRAACRKTARRKDRLHMTARAIGSLDLPRSSAPACRGHGRCQFVHFGVPAPGRPGLRRSCAPSCWAASAPWLRGPVGNDAKVGNRIRWATHRMRVERGQVQPCGRQRAGLGEVSGAVRLNMIRVIWHGCVRSIHQGRAACRIIEKRPLFARAATRAMPHGFRDGDRVGVFPASPVCYPIRATGYPFWASGKTGAITPRHGVGSQAAPSRPERCGAITRQRQQGWGRPLRDDQWLDLRCECSGLMRHRRAGAVPGRWRSRQYVGRWER